MKAPYVIAISTLLYVLASFGIILPFLFSAPSSALVIVGIVYMISMPVIIYVQYKAFIKSIVKENEIEHS